MQGFIGLRSAQAAEKARAFSGFQCPPAAVICFSGFYARIFILSDYIRPVNFNL